MPSVSVLECAITPEDTFLISCGMKSPDNRFEVSLVTQPKEGELTFGNSVLKLHVKFKLVNATTSK